MKNADLSTDIAIVGGGLVGYCLALSLSELINQGLRVKVLESSAEAPGNGADSGAHSESFDHRVTALSAGSIRHLRNWQVWPLLEPQCNPVTQVEVSEKSSFQTLRLTPDETGEALGAIAPNKAIGQALQARLKQLSGTGLQTQYNAQVQNIEFQPGQATIHFKNGEPITASLVILADGGRSNLKTKYGFTQETLDFNQTAIIATFSSQKSHNDTAFERFTPLGPMAVLPVKSVNENLNALVWSIQNQALGQVTDLDQQDFNNLIQHHFGQRLGKILNSGERYCYPLVRSFTPEQVRSRLVLLGNSAITLHPLAGQGLNLALRAVDRLTHTITRQWKNDNLGVLSDLLEYQHSIRKDQVQTMTFCDQLVNLHQSNYTRLFRGFGLGLLDHHVITKSVFSRKAKGLSAEQQSVKGII